MFPETMFLSSSFSKYLLSFHLLFLVIFIFIWSRPYSPLTILVTKVKLDSDGIAIIFMYIDIIHILFTSNFIGIVFARSLHYQFYSWYFYTLPYMLWRTDYNLIGKLSIFFAIEYAWNIYPSTVISSGILLSAHLLILVGLYMNKVERQEETLKFQ
jgi:alpha-1,3-mannosyltransferase